MKAILVHEFGGPEVLKYEEVPTPKPGAGQVFVRIHAAGVNPYDTYMRAGTYAIKPPLPYTPGSDAAGVVEAIGEGVKKVKPGDRVYTAKTVTGAYAQYALALEGRCTSCPKKQFRPGCGSLGALRHGLSRAVSFTRGARLGDGAGARRERRSRKRRGTNRARHGHHCVWYGGTEKGLDLVKREGAHRVFDHSKAGYQDEIMKATNGRGVDIILEMLANVNLVGRPEAPRFERPRDHHREPRRDFD